jgi:hypothetical protein
MPVRPNPWPIVALFLYWLALLLPSVVLHPGIRIFGPANDDVFVGAVCLLYGWAMPAWYANLGIVIAAIAFHFRAPRLALVASIAAVVDGLSVFCYRDNGLRVHVGFFVWIASMAAMAIASAESIRAHRRDQNLIVR